MKWFEKRTQPIVTNSSPLLRLAEVLVLLGPASMLYLLALIALTQGDVNGFDD